MKDRDTGESKGYAFIAFKTKEVAQKAIEELHGKEFKVNVVLVDNLSSFLLKIHEYFCNSLEFQ